MNEYSAEFCRHVANVFLTRVELIWHTGISRLKMPQMYFLSKQIQVLKVKQIEDY